MSALPENCAACDAHLVSLACGEEAGVPVAAREHLLGCERCRSTLDDLRLAHRAASTLPLEEPDARVDAGILAALDAHLAGEDLSPFLRLPDPEQTPAAQPAAPARPHLTALPGGRRDEAPQMPLPRTVPARRRSMGGMAAAASVALVAGGALYFSRETNLATHRDDTVAELAPLMPEAAEEAAGPFADAPAKPPAGAKPAEEAKLEARDKAEAQATRRAAEPPTPKPMRTPAPEAKEKTLALVPPSEARMRAQLPAGPVAATPMPQELPADGRRGAALGGGGGDVDLDALRQIAAGSVAKDVGGMKLSGRANAGPAPAAPPPAAAAPRPAPMPDTSRSAAAAPPPPAFAPPLDEWERADSEPRAQRQEGASGAARSFDREKKAAAESLAKEDDAQAEKPAAPGESLLAFAQAALARGEYDKAAELFGKVVEVKGASEAVVRAAMKGRIGALVALGRLDEAERARAEYLPRFPGVGVSIPAAPRKASVRSFATESDAAPAARPEPASEAPASK